MDSQRLKQSDKLLFQFAVISDSHIRLPGAAEEGGYASNRLSVARAEYAVRCVNKLRPDFVVHLGDLVHPIPALPIHEAAVARAREIFAGIDAPFYAMPGNHDIGDKPNAWLPAPVVEEESHLVFARQWGPLYQSFAVQNCRFICLDTPIMNSGFPREEAQRAWLEKELHLARERGQRVFVFMHYPLFICHPEEPTHYDNIAEPARSWLLGLFEQHSVEAVFSGHVHHVFIGIGNKTVFYSLPSLAFVRPEYAELATVAPGDEEYGRNDTAKLGFFMVRIFSDRHEIRPIRTYGTGQLASGMPPIEPVQMAEKPGHMLGVSLRRGWGRRVELAADGLDEFQRKEAYRDGLLLALVELGVTHVRVPFADLALTDVRRRLSDWVRLGVAFTVYSLGVPDDATLAAVAAHGRLLRSWEIILPDSVMTEAGTAVRRARTAFSGQLFLAPVVPIKPADPDGLSFQHFASHGFAGSQAGEAERWLARLDGPADDIGLTFRVSPWEEPAAALAEMDRQCQRIKLVNLQLPRRDEGIRFDDDDRLQAFVVAAYQASRKMGNTAVFIDTFVDSDRGYYPRNGLLDRSFNPRPAFYALKLASLSQLSSE